MVVTEISSRKVLGINQRSYHNLKLALTLNLRRQLLIAVCDSTILQNQFATQLETDIAQSSIQENRAEDGLLTQSSALTHLVLNAEHPDLVAQLRQWLQQAPQSPLPSLQVLGIEQMTRQSLMAQHHFLQSLEKIETLLPHLESNLVIWLPWPWFRAIQQSANRFWQWRSGVFEFIGEPTPLVTLPDTVQSNFDDLTGARPIDELKFTQTFEIRATGRLYGESVPSSPIPAAESELDLPTATPADLWTLLSEDLAQLEQAEALSTAPLISAPVTSLFTENELTATPLSTSSDLPATLAMAEPAAVEPIQAPNQASAPSPVPDQQVPDEQAIPPLNAAIVDTELATYGAADQADLRFEAPGALQQSQAEPQVIARAYLDLGHYYRERIETGEVTTELVAAASKAYEEGLRWLPEGDSAWGTALNDLGTLYWMQAQQQRSREALLDGMHRSLSTYQKGLDRVNQKLQPDIASRLHSNLGAVYSTLASYDNALENLNQAVSAYRQALPLCSVDSQPDEYATLQNSLGSIYWKLSHYDQAKSCLHRAIAAYNEALRCRHPEKAPLDYAAVQNNLGIAYWSLSKHERPVFLLKHAIAAYRDALNYRTPNTDPAACASTYNNLGTAYWELGNQIDPSADPENRYRQNAAIAYEAALQAAQLAPTNLDLQSIHHCLGNVYDQLAQTVEARGAIAAHLQKSLQHHLAAIDQLSKLSPNYEPIFKSLVRSVRNHYEKLGTETQQRALNQLPAHLLPDVMQSL